MPDSFEIVANLAKTASLSDEFIIIPRIREIIKTAKVVGRFKILGRTLGIKLLLTVVFY